MSVTTDKPAGAKAIRPFHVDVLEDELDDLRRRIAATRWPERETVDDQSQGHRRSPVEEIRRGIRAAGFEPAERDARFQLRG